MSCENCKGECKSHASNVPYVAHEGMISHMERTIKRLWILAILLAVLLVGTNAFWIWRESQFEDIAITQENADGYDNFIGNDGDILNGETDN